MDASGSDEGGLDEDDDLNYEIVVYKDLIMEGGLQDGHFEIEEAIRMPGDLGEANASQIFDGANGLAGLRDHDGSDVGLIIIIFFLLIGKEKGNDGSNDFFYFFILDCF